MNDKNISAFARFVVVGAVSTALNYAVFYFLLKYLHVNYLLSSVSGYVAGLLLGLLLNNFWTFKRKQLSSTIILFYTLVYLASLLLGTAFLWLTVEQLGFNVLVMNVITICITTCLNFIGLNFFVYKYNAHAE